VATVKVTEKMVKEAIAATDWAAIDAMTDEDIARQIEENPDAAPNLSKPRMRRVFRVLSNRLPPNYRVRLLRRSLRLTRAQFSESFGIPLKTLQGWEQGLREPDGTAMAYLALIAEMPEKIRWVRSRLISRRPD
jgi:putative transcriptional regulator